ncbi:MAG: hypothetical protein AABX04_03850 [Nanoarchaeota archaeon]
MRTYNFSSDYIEAVAEIFNPQLVISHRRSLDMSLQLRDVDPCLAEIMKEEIETFLINKYWGKIQTDTNYLCRNSVEFKEGFVRRMQEESLPFPRTVLREEVSRKDWNYNYLNKYLNVDVLWEGFYLKDISLQRSKGVHYVRNSHGFKTKPNLKIAQQKVTPDDQPACSLRITTFPNQIIGGFFRYSPGDNLCSNSLDEGKIPIDIGNGVRTEVTTEILDLMQRTGLTKEGRVLPEVLDLALKVSKIYSQSLLRGIDVIFDAEARPYVVEAQTGPGNPEGYTYASLLGLKPNTPQECLDLTVRVISESLERFLQRK